MVVCWSDAFLHWAYVAVRPCNSKRDICGCYSLDDGVSEASGNCSRGGGCSHLDDSACEDSRDYFTEWNSGRLTNA